MSGAADIISRVRLSDVCRVHGIEPQRGRIPAPWRKTSDRNVSINDEKGTWFDQVAGEGGGIIDFVCRVRGGSRRAALQWCADLVGVPLEDQPLSAADRARWAQQRRDLELHLPAARHWRRAAMISRKSR